MTKIATVSYLNALPLIVGLEEQSDITLTRHVPSELLGYLENRRADVALCPVIDFQTSSNDLEIVPSGAIGCHGPALTVKLFSRLPPVRLESIVVDGESHTSVALLRIVMHELHRREPTLVAASRANESTGAEAVLLIGDKVVQAPPDPSLYPHQLDLGEAWKRISGKPFIFATWMTRMGTDLGDVPERLDRVRLENRNRLPDLARGNAASNGWPIDLAVAYLSRNLRYELGPPELAGIEEFWRRCHELGIIDKLKAMRLYDRES
jgi:chorismate dehydratase